MSSNAQLPPDADPRLDTESPLTPSDAVAALILVEGRYLMQRRDANRGIWFPAQWGCFGGAVDPGEEKRQALHRELDEELALKVADERIRHFTRFEFDFGFAGLAPIWREFYELEITRDEMAGLELKEGEAMGLLDAKTILTAAEPITPYDSFGLWMHINQGRLTA